MSRWCVVLPLFLCAFCVFAAAQEKYEETFDNLDLSELLSDEERLKAAIKCLEDSADSACRPAGKFLKAHLAEIVATDCAKCTDLQKEKVGGFFAFVSQHYPAEMKKLLDKYDTTQEYRKKYAESWKESGIKV